MHRRILHFRYLQACFGLDAPCKGVAPPPSTCTGDEEIVLFTEYLYIEVLLWFVRVSLLTDDLCMQQEQEFDGAVMGRLLNYSLAELEHLFLEFFVELTAVSPFLP